MFSSVKGFISRHKRKFVISGVIVGGTILAVRYARYKLRELQEKQTRELVERTRRMQHFESTERTCNQVIIGLSTNLGNEIIKILNTDEILTKLRKNPENKVELWEELKIMCFTRLTTLIYSSSMLVVTLRVQLNLLGGYLYKDTQTEGQKISDKIKSYYLSLVQHFLSSSGLSDLENLIKSKVNDVMKTYPLDVKFKLTDLEQIFWAIQTAINGDSQDPNKAISTYVFPKTINDEGILKKMFSETLDMLESDEVAELSSNNVSRGFSIAVDNIAEYYAGIMKTMCKNESDKPSTSKDQLNSIVNINTIQLPLAKIIPHINAITSKSFDGNTNPQNLATSLITCFLLSDKVKMLGANVYEVFSV